MVHGAWRILHCMGTKALREPNDTLAINYRRQQRRSHVRPAREGEPTSLEFVAIPLNSSHFQTPTLYDVPNGVQNGVKTILEERGKWPRDGKVPDGNPF